MSDRARIILTAFAGYSWARTRKGLKGRLWHLRTPEGGAWCSEKIVLADSEGDAESVTWGECCKHCWDGYKALMCDGDERTKLMKGVRNGYRDDQ